MKNASVQSSVNLLTQKTSIFVVLLTIFYLISCKKEACPYCPEETCKLFENFEDDTINSSGNWLTLSAFASIQISPGTMSKTLYLSDASGGSWAYNALDFPTDMTGAGCALEYDVEFNAGGIANNDTSYNSIHIYQGPNPLSATARAVFVLNASSAIVSGAGVTHISVPLSLASGTTLPSNSFGSWQLIGGSSPTTTTDVANFNALIQNIGGVTFIVDSGGTIAEQWWLDNFCFKQCCP